MVRLLAFAAAALGFIASPALAQVSGGIPRVKERYEAPITDEYFFEGRFRENPAAAADTYSRALRFATCAARINAKISREVLTAAAGSTDETRILSKLAQRTRTCVVDHEVMPPIMLRGAIAETLWKGSGSIVNPTKRTEIELSEIENFVRAEPLGEMRAKVGTMPLSWASRCQVLILPRESAALLATKPGSSEEAALMTTIYGKSSVCGVPATLGGTGTIFARATMADALYQSVALADKISAK